MSAPPPELLELRQALHRAPELAHREHRTAERIRGWLERHRPAAIVDGLGGHGLAAVWRGRQAGPRVLLRAELDGLPIDETIELDHGSTNAGVAHKCGHDGHMTMVAGLAPRLQAAPPASGEVVLLFQPAEETGEGAARVLADEKFEPLRPDWAFALHNLPGQPLGQVVVRRGVFAAASCGLRIELEGATAHAAEPQRGRSPALAVASLIQSVSAVGQYHAALEEAAKATVVNAVVGEEAYGTSPGRGHMAITLRTYDDRVLERIERRCLELAEAVAATYGLDFRTSRVEPFPVTASDERAVAIVERAAAQHGLDVTQPAAPFPWSEDFGHFTAAAPGALFGLGSGAQQPALHHPTYDFPDELLASGVDLFESIVRQLTDSPPAAG